MEAECAFISFNDLLDKLEDLICDVIDKTLKSPAGQLIKDLNPVSVNNLLEKSSPRISNNIIIIIIIIRTK